MLRVLRELSNDEVGQIIRADETLMAYLRYRVRNKYGNFQCFSTEAFHDVVNAAMEAGFSEKTATHRQTCLGIGQALKKIATQLSLPGVAKSEKIRKDATEFLLLHAGRWSHLVGVPTKFDMLQVLNNSAKKIPSSDDVLLFAKKTTELLELAIEEFTGNPNLTTYRKLQKITLVKCITFNRRRGNDVAALNVAEFEKACATDVSGSNKVISETLSKKAKKNVEEYLLISTIGKQMKVNYVLLSKYRFTVTARSGSVRNIKKGSTD